MGWNHQPVSMISGWCTNYFHDMSTLPPPPEPLVSLQKSLLNPCFWRGDTLEWGRLTSHDSQLRKRHCYAHQVGPYDRYKWSYPTKLTWHWKITMFKRWYIFKWLFFHCHVSFRGCITSISRVTTPFTPLKMNECPLKKKRLEDVFPTI